MYRFTLTYDLTSKFDKNISQIGVKVNQTLKYCKETKWKKNHSYYICPHNTVHIGVWLPIRPLIPVYLAERIEIKPPGCKLKLTLFQSPVTSVWWSRRNPVYVYIVFNTQNTFIVSHGKHLTSGLTAPKRENHAGHFWNIRI
mgnify:CR=1 FL=1